MPIRNISAARQLVRNFGTCLNFTNSTDIINLGTTNPFTGSFYFSGWVKWKGLNGAFQSIFAKRNSYAADDLMFDFNLVNTTGKLTIDTITSYVQFNYELPLHKWVHLVWVHDVVGGKDKLYINGELVSNQNIGTLGTGTSAPITVGGDQSPGQQNFNGRIDEISIGTFTASQAQVDDMFFRSIYASSNVWTLLKLDEGSGTTATDTSGSGNNGTITGATYVTDKVMTTRTAVANRFIIPLTTQKSLSIANSPNAAVSPINPDLTTGFNFSFWWKPNHITAEHGLVNWESTFDRNGFSFRQNNGGEIAIVGSNGSTTVFILTNTGKKEKPGIWIFLTVTYNSSKQVKVYRNGTQILSGSGTITSNATNMAIGRRSHSNSMYANGLFKNFTFQNIAAAWTTQQIDDLYWRNKIPSGALQWSMNDVATDQNGENALTLTGTSYSTDVPPHMKPRIAV